MDAKVAFIMALLLGCSTTFGSIDALENKTLVNAIVAVIIMMVSIFGLLLKRRSLPQCDYQLLFLNVCMVLWVAYVTLAFGDGGIVKLASMVVNFVFIGLLILIMLSGGNREGLLQSFAGGLIVSAVLFCGLSWLADRPSISNIYNPMFDRYEGLAGPNYHGAIAATGCVLTMLRRTSAVLTHALKLTCVLFLMLNVWMTGSRSSIFIIVLFSLVCGLMTRWRWPMLVLLLLGLPLVVWWTVFAMPVELRFDEYSFVNRWLPVQTAWELLLENSWRPYGIGFVHREMQVLDNTYLVIALELGVAGLLGMLAVLYRAIWLAARNAQDNFAQWCCVSFAVSLLVHGLFETMLLIGVHYITVCFWWAVVAAFLRGKRRECMDSQRSGLCVC